MVVVKFNACGVTYSVEKAFLDTGPISKLSKLCAGADSTNVICINRPPDLFYAILTLYLTGDLHIPMTSCPGAFLKEMEFWEIDTKYLSNCCFYKLQCHLEEQRTLTSFHQHIVGQEEYLLAKGFESCATPATVRARIWSIVDYKGRDALTGLYFVFALLMILLSIMTISLGTCESFRRNMTNCERLEFMEATNMDHIDTFSGLIRDQDCGNTTLPGTSHGGLAQYSFDNDYQYIEVQMSDNFTDSPPGETTTPLLGSDSGIISIRVPNMKVPMYVLVILDLLTLVFFSIDFVLRLLSCPSIFSYFKSIINIADTAALVGTYMHLVLLQVHKEEKYRDDWVDVLALMQMLRSFRLFRLVRNITAARVLAYTFIQNLKDLSILLLFIIVGICSFSSLIYIIEHEKYHIENVPMGWYWALITMTTVGYGDIVPVSVAGKVVGCVCAVTGLLLFALTIPIFANQFLALYQYANLKCFSRLNCKDVKTDGAHVNGVELMTGSIITTMSDQVSEAETVVTHIDLNEYSCRLSTYKDGH